MLAVIPIMSLCLFGNAFVESYWQYAALHLIYCTAIPVLWINSHTLSIEFFSSSHKRILLCTKVMQISTARDATQSRGDLCCEILTGAQCTGEIFSPLHL